MFGIKRRRPTRRWTRTTARAALVTGCSLGFAGAVAAPQALAITYSQATLPLPYSALSSPRGIAVDAHDNVYVADSGNNRIVELSDGSESVVPFTGLSTPTGVAVDSAGDVFALDAGSPAEVEELPAGGAAQKTLPFTGLNDPLGIAADGAGDVYVANFGANQVLEVAAGASTQTTVPFTGLAGPFGIAVDSAKDIFVSNYNSGNVVERTVGGTQKTLITGLSAPSQVAVDAGGDVFAGAAGYPVLTELPYGGTPQVLPLSGVDAVDGVAVDSAGDVFASYLEGDDVYELTPSVPSGSIALAPGSGPAGTTFGIASVTPCPMGGPFSTTTIFGAMTTASGAVLAYLNSTPDVAGNWTASVTVPTSAANGIDYVHVYCENHQALRVAAYAYAAFQVEATSGSSSTTSTPSSSPLGVAGASTRGATGATGPVGATGNAGTRGDQGVVAPAGSSPAGSAITCRRSGASTSCTVLYRYAAARTLTVRATAEATIMRHGRVRVIGRGRVLAGGRVRLRYAHLRSGRYRVTLTELRGRSKPLALGHTTLVIS